MTTPKEPLQIISLGAGVQSSTMALMAARGEITPMPDAAIFADTQSEPAAVYKHLDWLEKQLPFPVFRVTAGNLGAALLESARGGNRAGSHARPPVYIKADDGSRGGMVRRQCTGDFKIDPIRRKVREMVGLTRKKSPMTPVVHQWIGISTDEIYRMKISRDPWVEFVYPLIDAKMSRDDCHIKLAEYGWTAPKSACFYCPFHSDAEWLRLKTDEPKEFDKAVKFERDVQALCQQQTQLRSNLHLHRSALPLDQIDFEKLIKDKAAKKTPEPMFTFMDECTGMCGV